MQKLLRFYCGITFFCKIYIKIQVFIFFIITRTHNIWKSQSFYFLFFLSFSFNFCKTRKTMVIHGGGLGGVMWLEIKGLIPDAFGICAGGKTPYP
jgi:hypothetical protein